MQDHNGRARRVVLAGGLWLIAAAGSIPAQTAPALPQTPGHHNLFFQTTLNQQPYKMPYAVFLPREYATRPAPRAMLVFLMGVGQIGTDHRGIYEHGPACEFQRTKALGDWADFIVLSPQCTPGLRWESAGLPQVVVQLIDFAKKTWRVDADRVYLTGLSMGGTGTWHIALAAPRNTFAAIAPLCGQAVEPDKLAVHLKGATTWIISPRRSAPSPTRRPGRWTRNWPARSARPSRTGRSSTAARNSAPAPKPSGAADGTSSSRSPSTSARPAS